MGNGNDLSRSTPIIDATTGDAEGLIADLIAYARATFPTRVWTDFTAGQLGRLMLEMQAVQFDLGTFQINALLNETRVATAIRENNLRAIAKGYDYVPGEYEQATGPVRLTLDPLGVYPVDILAATHSLSRSDGAAYYYPVADVTVTAADALVGYVDVSFVEGLRYNAEALGTSTGLGSQRFQLANANPVRSSVVVRVNGTPWTRVDSLVDMLPGEQKYLLELNDSGRATIIFGDGEHGQVPTAGHAIEADYVVSVGRVGNVGTNRVNTIVSMPAVVTAAINSQAAMSGGSNGPTTQQLRAEIPASNRTKQGIINNPELADAATLVSGVAKAYAVPGNPYVREDLLFIAPNGGGAPSSVLKNQVALTLAPKATLGKRILLQDPVYKQLRISVIAHVRNGVRKDQAEAAIRQVLTNTDGTGALDFDQVNFGGLDSDFEPQVSIDSLDDILDGVKSVGIKRFEYTRLDVIPEMRRLRPTSGDGTVTGISTPSNDTQRREWVIRFTSATTFTVRERIIGYVSVVEDTRITDESASYPTWLVGLGFTTLCPDRRLATIFAIASSGEDFVQTTLGGLFLATQPGSEYYIERGNVINDVTGLPTGTVGSAFEARDADGQVVLVFTANAGASPWTSGDEVIIDTYAPVGVLRLRNDEIPELDLSNLTIRVAGGIRT